MSKISKQKALEKTTKNIEAFELTKTFNWMKESAEQKTLEELPLKKKRKCVRTSHTTNKTQLIQELIEEMAYELEQES